MDRRVISPSLFNPDWEDMTKFPFNPDFDLGMGDFLPDLTLPTVLEEESSLCLPQTFLMLQMAKRSFSLELLLHCLLSTQSSLLKILQSV